MNNNEIARNIDPFIPQHVWDGDDSCHILTDDLYQVAASRKGHLPFQLAVHTPKIKTYTAEDLVSYKLTSLQLKAVMGYYRELYLVNHLSLEEIAKELRMAPSNLKKYKDSGLIKVVQSDWYNLRKFIVA